MICKVPLLWVFTTSALYQGCTLLAQHLLDGLACIVMVQKAIYLFRIMCQLPALILLQ